LREDNSSPNSSKNELVILKEKAIAKGAIAIAEDSFCKTAIYGFAKLGVESAVL